MNPPEAPASILVICTRRLGDVLLQTALLRSLRLAYPMAAIDVVTLQGSAPALAGNPDLRRVLSLPPGAGVIESLRSVGGWRRYDLAVCTLMDDRPHLLAFAAAARRVGVVPRAGERGARWKRWMLDGHVERQSPPMHVVEESLRLADTLGIARHPRLVPPRPPDTTALAALLGPDWQQAPYAVLHPMPLFSYKEWTADGWAALIAHLLQRGLRVVLTAGPAAEECAYVRALAARFASGVTALAGTLKFAELTPLIESARIFIGPDTSVTHLAAAAETPTVALFGPTPPLNWGPWPQGFARAQPSPWQMRAAVQRQGQVWIVQGITHCVPCKGEGCDKHRLSRSACLDQMPASRVIAVADQALSP